MIKVYGPRAEFHSRIAEALRLSDRCIESIDEIDKAILLADKDDALPDLLWRKAAAHRHLGNDSLAVQTLRIVPEAQRTTSIWEELAGAYESLGRTSQAAACYQKSAEKCRFSVRLHAKAKGQSIGRLPSGFTWMEMLAKVDILKDSYKYDGMVPRILDMERVLIRVKRL